MEETPYQKKTRERAEVRSKLKAISSKIGLGCDFLPMFNGEWIDISAWDGNRVIDPTGKIRISKDELVTKTVDEILSIHQKDFVWLSGSISD